MDASNRFSTHLCEPSRGLRTAEIELRAELGARERNWLLARLMAQSGIKDAGFSNTEQSLLIEYDAELVSGAELVNFLYLCGSPAPSRGRR